MSYLVQDSISEEYVHKINEHQIVWVQDKQNATKFNSKQVAGQVAKAQSIPHEVKCIVLRN